MKCGGVKLALWAQNKSFDTQPVKMFGNNKFESAQTQLCAMYFLKLNKIYFEEQNDKQLYRKHYTENKRSSNTNHTKTRG